MKDTLDLVLTKTNMFLRSKDDNFTAIDRTCADDWDILSHIPFSFEGPTGRRFDIFAASLKVDPVKAFSLMVLPEDFAFDLVRTDRRIRQCRSRRLNTTRNVALLFPIQGPIHDFARCRHNDSPPAIYGDFFLPVVGSFVINTRDDDDSGDQSETFFRDFRDRKVRKLIGVGEILP